MYSEYLIVFLILCILWMHQKTFSQQGKTISTLTDQNDKYFERTQVLQERLYDAQDVKKVFGQILAEETKR